ncbi:shikimate kinase [bacterium]|nr:shikimate kinase [bacterium]
MIISLIGYRGTGKSSVAPALAERLGWDWVDADVALESRAGRSIREIFATDGEPEFRRLERETLKFLLQRDHLVIAAGGGAILNAETRRDFRHAGPVVWLTAEVATIAARLQADPTTAARRPSLTGQSFTDEIASVLKVREPLYRETATIIMPTEHRTVAEIVREILVQLPADITRPGVHLSGDPF